MEIFEVISLFELVGLEALFCLVSKVNLDYAQKSRNSYDINLSALSLMSPVLSNGM